MTSIKQIPYEDIEILLLDNGIDIINDMDLNYELAYEILHDKNANIRIVSIVEWMIAHNLIVRNKKIPLYNKYDIINMPYRERKNLALKLTMKAENTDNIINILRYLGKLDERDPLSNLFFNLDLTIEVMNNLSFENIKTFCEVIKNKEICKSKEFKYMIRNKIKEIDNMDISTYDLNELLLYAKMLDMGKRGNEIQKLNSNINQKIRFLEGDLILTNKGTLYKQRYSELWTREVVFITYKISNVSLIGDDRIIIMLATGRSFYSFKGIFPKEIPIKNVVKATCLDNIEYYLTYGGDVYFVNKKEGYDVYKKTDLGTIINIDEVFAISENGKKYKLSNYAK